MTNVHFTSFSDEDVDFIVESIDSTMDLIKPGMKVNSMDVLASFQSAKLILLSRGNRFSNPEISAVLTALQMRQEALLNLPSKVPFNKPNEELLDATDLSPCLIRLNILDRNVLVLAFLMAALLGVAVFSYEIITFIFFLSGLLVLLLGEW